MKIDTRIAILYYAIIIVCLAALTYRLIVEDILYLEYPLLMILSTLMIREINKGVIVKK